jgi:hypothetical protein
MSLLSVENTLKCHLRSYSCACELLEYYLHRQCACCVVTSAGCVVECYKYYPVATPETEYGTSRQIAANYIH